MAIRTGQRARSLAVSLATGALLLPLGIFCGACEGMHPAPDATGPTRPEPARADLPPALSAAPGEIAVLAPTPATLGAPVQSFAWSQVGGPPVALLDAERPQAHFVVPDAADGAELTFALAATRASGEVVSEERVVRCSRGSAGGGTPAPTAAPQFAVFQATKDLAVRADLYLARLDGSSVFRLNAPLAPGRSIYNYRLSPDRRHVAYLAQNDSGAVELHVARTDGGGVKKVSRPLVEGGNVLSMLWSPDGTRLLYAADAVTRGRPEVWAVRPDGSGHVRISGPLVDGGYANVGSAAWSPDGTRVAYFAVQNTLGVPELFTSRADGTGNARVSAPAAAGGGCSGYYAWSPDGARLAYTGRLRDPDVWELFTVRPDGGGHAVASGTLVQGGGVAYYDFAWSPDGSRLAYRADQRYADVWELYTVRPDGSGGTLASSINPYAGSDVYSMVWSPDGTRILYAADQVTVGITQLFTSGPDGAANVRVSHTPAQGGWVQGWNWAPDGSRIGYLTVTPPSYVGNLFSVRPDGEDRAQLEGALAPGGTIYDSRWSPDARTVAFLGSKLAVGVPELFTVAAEGGEVVRVSGTPVQGGGVRTFDWSADGSRLVYLADQRVRGQAELFVAAPDGSAVNAAISGPLTQGGAVLGFLTR